MEPMSAPGSKGNPISRRALVEKWLPILRELHAQPSYIFQKVTPTMVLFPSPEELAVPMETETPPEIQAYMMRSATGDTFAAAMTKKMNTTRR